MTEETKYNSDTRGWTYFKVFINSALLMLLAFVASTLYESNIQWARQTEQTNMMRKNDDMQTEILKDISQKIGNLNLKTSILSVEVKGNRKDIDKNTIDIEYIKKRVK